MTETEPSGISIGRETIEIIFNDIRYELDCEITFHLQNRTIFTTITPHLDLYGLIYKKSISAVVKGTTSTLTLFASHCVDYHSRDSYQLKIQFKLQSEPVAIRDYSHLSEVKFSIANLGSFFIQQDGHMTRNNIELCFDQWQIQIEGLTSLSEKFWSSAESTEFKITHLATLRQKDSSIFSSIRAQEILIGLSVFLTFCRGQSIAPVHVRGYDKNGDLKWQEFGTRPLSPDKRVLTWFDRMHGAVLSEAFGCFMAAWMNQEIQEIIQPAVHWYSKTNSLSVGPDGGLVLVQAALERMAWYILVTRQEILSNQSFTKIPAGESLHLLLSTLNIPTAIPPVLKELNKQAKERNWRSGPIALAEIRNSIVHPPKKDSKNFPYFESFLLSHWYLELTLLRLINYNGVYCNRIKEWHYAGQVEPVPWA